MIGYADLKAGPHIKYLHNSLRAELPFVRELVNGDFKKLDHAAARSSKHFGRAQRQRNNS
jgi:hypothetical protein